MVDELQKRSEVVPIVSQDALELLQTAGKISLECKSLVSDMIGTGQPRNKIVSRICVAAAEKREIETEAFMNADDQPVRKVADYSDEEFDDMVNNLSIFSPAGPPPSSRSTVQDGGGSTPRKVSSYSDSEFARMVNTL